MSAASEDTSKKEQPEEFIDKDTLTYLALASGIGGLLIGGGLFVSNWMKEQDQQKRKIAMQDQMLKRQQQHQDMMRQRQQQDQQGWPNPIPRNTVPQSAGVMELPSEEEREQQEDQFVGYRQPPPSSYNTNNEQKFLVSDDPMANMNYPVINPNASPQQIGSKISRVMSMDGQYQPNSQQQQQPQQIRQQGDDEDFSDLF